MMALRSSSFQKLLRLDGPNKLVLVEAIVTLAAASLVIRFLPFRRTVDLMHIRVRAPEPMPAERKRIVAQCRWAVTSLADRVPWKAVCFQRGLTLHLMLRRRGVRSILHYGVAPNAAQGIRAHVWVGVDEDLVLGGEEAGDFASVAAFPSSSL